MKKINSQKGQALITLIFFTVIAAVVITAAISVVFTNNSAASSTEQGLAAYGAAESGAEEGYIQLLRDPTLVTGGTFNETFNVDSGTVTVDITYPTITSTANLNGTKRIIRVNTLYNSSSGTFSISSWGEI